MRVLTGILIGFAVIQWFVPLGTAIKIGADEDFELAKATLSLNGYKFYTEVWNDQPLLHTFLVTQVLTHLSPSVLGPRLVTSLFAAVLLASVYLMSLRISGLLVAALTTALVIASPGFLELSSSCMVEIPGLAPVVAGLAMLLIGRKCKWRSTEILAGILFALALQIKFIGIIYLPLAGLILWLRCREPVPLLSCGSWRSGQGDQSDSRVGRDATTVRSFCRQLLLSSLAFVAGLTISFGALNFLMVDSSGLLQLKQTWSAHFASANSFEYGSPADHPFDWSVLLKNWDTTLPAIVGMIILARKVRVLPHTIILLAWLGLTVAVFSTHTPWWSYYYIHNAVPLCLCAAVATEAACQSSGTRTNRALSAALAVYLVCAVPWMASRVYLQIASIRRSPQTYNSLILTEIGRFKPFTKFIYTDEPVYSFHTGIPMPPKLGIVSLKRLWSGDLTSAMINQELWTTKPGVILLANDTRATPFDDLLLAEYRLVYQDDKHRLYALKSVIAQAK